MLSTETLQLDISSLFCTAALANQLAKAIIVSANVLRLNKWSAAIRILLTTLEYSCLFLIFNPLLTCANAFYRLIQVYERNTNAKSAAQAIVCFMQNCL